jgi:hypothetical protein
MSDFIKVRSEYPPTVPLSHLELELPSPVEGWHAFLAAKGIRVVGDDLGRDAVARHDAARLFGEKREHEVRQAALRRLAQIWKGVPADAMPPGASPASVMLQATKDSRPKRTSVLQDALDGGGTVMHTFNGESEDW